MISAVLVVVDIGFAGGRTGLAGGCGGGTVDKDTVVREDFEVVGLAVNVVGGTVATRGVTGGKGLVTRTLGCELKGGKEATRLGGKGRDCYKFLPFSCVLPCLCSTISLLPLCSFA